MPTDYLVQESDGTSRFLLEDGSGFIILETSISDFARERRNVTAFVHNNEVCGFLHSVSDIGVKTQEAV